VLNTEEGLGDAESNTIVFGLKTPPVTSPKTTSKGIVIGGFSGTAGFVY